MPASELNRGVTVGLRSQIAALSSYDDTMQQVNVRLQLAQTTLTRIDDIGHSVKTSAVSSQFAVDNSGQTDAQKSAYSSLDEIFGLLNTQAGNHYLFSGKATDQPAVDTTDHIMNGDGSRAGFKQVAAERLQADLGANGLGRLVIPPAAGSAVSIAEDAARLAVRLETFQRRHDDQWSDRKRPAGLTRRHFD